MHRRMDRRKSSLAGPVHIIFIIFFLNNSTCMSWPVALLSFRSTENPVHIIWCSRCYPFHLRWSWLWVDIRHSDERWPWSIFACGDVVIDLLSMPCSKRLLLTFTLYFDEITSLLLTVTLLSVFYSSHWLRVLSWSHGTKTMGHIIFYDSCSMTHILLDYGDWKFEYKKRPSASNQGRSVEIQRKQTSS